MTGPIFVACRDPKVVPNPFGSSSLEFFFGFVPVPRDSSEQPKLENPFGQSTSKNPFITQGKAFFGTHDEESSQALATPTDKSERRRTLRAQDEQAKKNVVASIRD